MEVYLDNSATTRCYDEVAALVSKVMCTDYGNPSSMHHKGVEAEQYLRYARETLARLLKVNEKEILFTSGGTEADNIALIGTAMANHRRGRHLITTRMEHPAVLQTMAYLERQGFEVTYLPVDHEGRISLSDLERAIRKDTILVSIMHVNNEIGSVQPIAEAGELIKRCNPQTLFHVDAVQGFGKFRIHPARMEIDMLSVSGHKIHGPKGVGFLYIRSGSKVNPIVYGGGQQRNMRSGTENVPGIAGLAQAAQEAYEDFGEKQAHLYRLKEAFIQGLEGQEWAHINGKSGEDGAPHIVSLSVDGVRSEVLLHALEDRHIYVSAGSACASNKPAVSATLKAIGVRREYLDSTVRISFCAQNTLEEVEYCIANLKELVPMLGKYTRR